MNKDELIEIGTIIKVERKYRNLAQKDLAEILSINQSSISRMENGDTNITMDLYEQVLNQLNMSLMLQPTYLEIDLVNIYHELDSLYSTNTDKIYQKAKSIEILRYDEYYIKLLIEACYNMYHEKFHELREIMSYVHEVEFLFKERVRYIFLMLTAFSYHTTRDYVIADLYFRQAMAFKNQYKLEEGIMLYSNAYNHIILGRIHLAQLSVLKLMDKFENVDSYRFLAVKRLLGLIYLFDSNAMHAMKVLLDCKDEKFFQRSQNLRYQLNSFLGIINLSKSYFLTALTYFKNNIENNYLLEYSYAFTLYCLKKLEYSDEFLIYKMKVVNEPFYQTEMSKRLYIDLFISDDYLIDIKQLTENFSPLYQEFFCRNDRYHYTKLFFDLIKEELWRKRKYLVYKQLNDFILEYRLGGKEFAI